MAQNNEVDLDLPHPYYAAIGEYIFLCSQLEYQISKIIWRAMDLDNKQGRTLTIGMKVNVLRGILTTITNTDRWVKNKTHLQEINVIRNQCREFSKLRIHLAYGVWGYLTGGDKSNVALSYMKESNEKMLVKRDTSITDAEFHRRIGKVRAINLRAQRLIE